LSAADTVVTAGSRYTTTIYARAAERSWIQLQEGQGVTAGAYFDLANGTVGTVSGTGSPTAAITSAGSGWYRCQISWTSVGNAARIRVFLATGDGAAVYSGDGTSGVYLTGAQLELGSTASTYQQIVTPEISFLQYQPQPVMYTDSAGTTPVTAVEQAVGLMLDKSKGLVLGSELVTNGAGTDTTGWASASSFASTMASVSGVFQVTATANFGRQIQAITCVVGKTYQVSAFGRVVSGSNNGFIGIVQSDGSGTPNFLNTSSATFVRLSFYFVATSTTHYISMGSSNAATGVTAYYDISVRELPGNHAFQTSSTKRPVLRARYNLLTFSEQFDNGAWTKDGLNAFGSGSVANTPSTLDPLGGNTADYIQENTSLSKHRTYQFYLLSGISYTFSCYIKAAQRTWAYLNFADTVGNKQAWFNLLNGTIGTVSAGLTASISSVGNGWYRCVVNAAAIAVNANLDVGIANADNSHTYTGDGTSGIFVWGADLRPASQATGLIGPTYQRIAAATDYDVVGFTPRIVFDAFDDALTTNNIDFSSTDKMTVFAGVRKLSDAANQMFAELSADGDSNNGTFYLSQSPLAPADAQFSSRGTANARARLASGFAAPITGVLTGIGDISGDVCTLRINGTQAATSSTDQGTGNYGNYPLFIGARNQTSLYFNGELYSLIGRGASTTAGQIAATEQWVAGKTGVQL
jgi:hypothetical protein